MGTVNILNISKFLATSILVISCSIKQHNQVIDVDKTAPPLIRTYPQSIDTILFDNLRFFKLMVVNNPENPKTVMFNVKGFHFNYSGNKFTCQKNKFSTDLIERIYIDKPEKIRIDSIYYIDNVGKKYYNKVNIDFYIEYPDENNFSCLEKGKSVDVKELIKNRKNGDLVNVNLAENNCPILCFYNMGSVFQVQISNSSEEVLYSKQLSYGEISIDNYFIFPENEILNVVITGDINWKGQLTR